MKIGAIPDVHGNKNYEQKIEGLIEANADHIIFLGDYCDSHTESNNWLIQKNCLDKILELKKTNPEYYTLLLGNHDLHYLSSLGASTSVSGRQHFAAADIQDYLLANYDHFQMIKIVDNWIFSHAGVSQVWLTNNSWELDDINKCFGNKEIQYFNHNSSNPYGDHESEGCTWIRPPSLINYGVKGYNQCVGHTALASENIDYWNLESRIVITDLENKYVFLDTPEQEYCSIIDTETNEVEIFRI